MRQSYLQVSHSVSPVENVPENVLLRATLSGVLHKRQASSYTTLHTYCGELLARTLEDD